LHNKTLNLLFLAFSLVTASCQKPTDTKGYNNHTMELSKDVHSFANPNEVAIKHMYLNLDINFDKHLLKGYVELTLDNKKKTSILHLDSRQLKIDSISTDDVGKTTFEIGKESAIFGSDLSVTITPKTKKVTIYYETSPDAEALQWLSAAQTHDKKHPFMFSQSQAILARTWIPCQDSPGIKFTYSADITCNPELMVLMSAKNDTTLHANGKYSFKQELPVSSYLLAIAAGDVQFKNLGRNSGVYAEPGQLAAASWEFVDMQSMIDKAEGLYGPYVWGRYDVLVLPPSFPFGGMENPCLTFATPTIIAGDRSLVSLVAHELAHSWSGNLVTNETWNDFWLNEGFTVYFEQRIMEEIYGKPYAEMLTLLGMDELKLTLKELNEEGKKDDTHLYLNLDGRNPDDGLTDVAYEKGRFFLQTIEFAVGRKAFDAFLKKYFTENAFHPMNTERFIAYLQTNLIKGDAALANKIQIKEWIYGPDLPSSCPIPASVELEKVAQQAALFNAGNTKAKTLDTKNWTTHHWLYFLRNLNVTLGAQKLADLDAAFGFTKSGNSEILCDWFKLAITNNYTQANPALEAFLIRVGRRKFLTPLYSRLAKTPANKTWAKAVYAKARPGYHAVAINTIDELLK
jgi:leukotriene-A4 hydrolase